jgi:hypothetical protein
VTWSADVVGDDWKRIGAREIVRRTMRRLEEKGRGILLFHDIHATTAAALPIILKELKERGYHVVQVVADGERPESLPDLPASADAGRRPAPKVAGTGQDSADTAVLHRSKKPITKRRKPAVATLHEREYNATFRGWRLYPF